MDWLLRFQLGLPARQEDARAVLRAVPEVLAPDWEIDPAHVKILFRYSHLYERWERFPRALREWVEPAVKRGRLSAGAISGSTPCPLPECPFREEQEIKPLGGLIDATFLNSSHFAPPQLDYPVISGGSKHPLAAFLNLVRTVHRGTGEPREVYLTDPFIFIDQSALQNLTGYLLAVGASQDSPFVLKTNPYARYRGRQGGFADMLRRTFHGATVASFESRYRFHDRFYLVNHRGNTLRGVVGPSLNGLTADHVVLMAALDHEYCLTRLQREYLSM